MSDLIFTSHGTVVILLQDKLHHVPLEPSTCEAATAFAALIGEPIRIEGGACLVRPILGWDRVLTLRSGEYYGCAEPGRTELIFDRSERGPWECFELRDFDSLEPSERRCDGISSADFTTFVGFGTSVLDARTQPDALTSSPAEASTAYDRIAISAARPNDLDGLISKAMSILTVNGLLLIDRCRSAEAARSIVSGACNGTLQPCTIDGQRQSPDFQVVRRPTKPVRPRERRIVLVAVFGERSRLEWAISGPITKRYAERVGAELMVIGGNLETSERPLAKMHALNHVDFAARVLLIDTDVLVEADAPDLFAIVPESSIGVFIESDIADRQKNLDDVCMNFKVRASGPFYANTGVLLLPSHMAARLRMSAVDRIIYIDGMYEQNYFNAIFHEAGFEVFNISDLFNCMPALSPNLVASAYFIHFAGGSVQAQRMAVWHETAASGGQLLRVEQHLTAKDFRIFDMRNALSQTGPTYDRLWQATLLGSQEGNFIMRDKRIFFACPTEPDRVVAWCDFGRTAPGDYQIDFLLDAQSLDRALGWDADESPVQVETSLQIDVVSTVGEIVTFLKTRALVENGAATASFSLTSAHDIGCRIYGSARPVPIYGVRLREIVS